MGELLVMFNISKVDWNGRFLYELSKMAISEKIAHRGEMDYLSEDTLGCSGVGDSNPYKLTCTERQRCYFKGSLL